MAGKSGGGKAGGKGKKPSKRMVWKKGDVVVSKGGKVPPGSAPVGKGEGKGGK